MPLRVIDRGDYQLLLAPEQPFWAATNREGARLLAALHAGATVDAWADDLAARDGLTRAQAAQVVGACAAEAQALWQPSTNGAYAGRAQYLRPTHLRELWLHLCNRCNFTCRHCLVSSGPERDDGLPTDKLLSLLAEARELGVVTFLLTGGEPLLRADLVRLLGSMLDDPLAHVVILTNGSLISDRLLTSLRAMDVSRLHLQVSLDGSRAELNDALRSPRAFQRATAGIRRAVAAGIDTTVTTVVLEANLHDLPDMARLLPTLGVSSWHLMWQHLRERGAKEPAATVEAVTAAVLALKPVADAAGVTIDNFDSFGGIVNGEPCTKRDGTNAAWDSLAIHADGGVFPSAALVGIEELRFGSVLNGSLRDIWLHSPGAGAYRRRSAVECASIEQDEFLLLHGGGDPEHAYFFGEGRPCAPDPYVPLYREIMLKVADEIVAERLAAFGRREDIPLVYHVMGQDGLGCPVDAGVANNGPYRIDFTHSNCVLNQDVVGHSRQIVQDYYGDAAVETKGEICCPIPVDRRQLDHIPRRVLERSYGCGSPVFAAGVTAGETVVDLGSGGGIECFVASKLVGPTGRVIGVDMTPEMLKLATEAKEEVAQHLGYGNVGFMRGYLEALPLGDATADVVISNCVINLSPQKLRVFSEIFRVLRPGGRMVISDIAAGGRVPEQVKFNPRLKGECIAGALTHEELLYMLTKLGFSDVQTLAELPWREVGGVEFFADTVTATKPQSGPRPLPYVGIERDTAAASGQERHESGCVVCGRPLQYLQSAIEATCAVCGRELLTRARCADGHFVCDRCHGGDYLRFVHSYLAQCRSTDPVEIFLQMREAHPFPVHGPEHHALVPGAFLVAYSNAHGTPSWDLVWEAVQTGAGLCGGSCAFWGACSAALGAGIAYSTILGAMPTSSRDRGVVQQVVSRILERIAALNAPRCCRRESLLSLHAACELSEQYLPAPLSTEHAVECDQVWANAECIHEACPFYPAAEKS